MTDLYRLVYTSRTLLLGSEAEIAEAVAQILQASQRNNAPAEVTGALMFNRGAFAQVLEGPRNAVETTFERIQRDPRHSDVTVLQCAPVAARGFPNWSMAFVGQSARGQALWGEMASASGFDHSRLSGDEVFSVLHGLVLDEEGPTDAPTPAPVAPPAPAPAPAASAPAVAASPVPADLDPRAQVRHLARSLVASADAAYVDALRAGRAGEPGSADASSGALAQLELGIVRQALRAERHRVADMAARIEEMQAALAAAEERAEHLRRGRDLWAERARLLAMPVFQGFAEAEADEGHAPLSGRPPLRSVA